MATPNTSGFRLSTMPQAPRLNPEEFRSGNQEFQAGLANEIANRANRLRLADLQRADEVAAATQGQRLAIEQGQNEQTLLGIPGAGEAQRAQNRATSIQAVPVAQAAVAESQLRVTKAQNSDAFFREYGSLMNKVEAAKLQHEWDDAIYDGDSIELQDDSYGVFKNVYRVNSKDGRRRKIGSVQLKTPREREQDITAAAETSELKKLQGQAAVATAEAAKIRAQRPLSNRPSIKYLTNPITGQFIGSVVTSVDPETGEPSISRFDAQGNEMPAEAGGIGGGEIQGMGGFDLGGGQTAPAAAPAATAPTAPAAPQPTGTVQPAAPASSVAPDDLGLTPKQAARLNELESAAAAQVTAGSVQQKKEEIGILRRQLSNLDAAIEQNIRAGSTQLIRRQGEERKRVSQRIAALEGEVSSATENQQSGAYEVGRVYGGMRYVGPDPYSKESWQAR